MKTLTVEDIDKLKIMGYITQVIPSSIILANLDTVTALKLKRLLTQTDPDSDIENAISGGGHDYSEDYLTFRIIQGGNLCWGSGVSEGRIIEYSINEGDWTEITSYPESIIPVNDGDIVRFKGDNTNGFGVFEYDVDIQESVCIGQAGGWFLDLDPETGDPITNAIFSIEGNIMSIVDSQNFAVMKELSTPYMFATFFGGGYANIPSAIPSAEHLILPATTLTDHCYDSMFADRTSLTTAPELPATTLADGCYDGMFVNCTSLTTAPELPATTLAESCYNSMFYGCTSLNYIKCLATDISAWGTTSWTYEVSATGTFIGVEGNPARWGWGTDGVPYGWECNFEIPEEPEGS